MTSDYLQKLARLRTDANRSRWTEATFHRARHKPFLLLSVMDLAAQGELTSPFIEAGFDLIERFARYWDLVRPPSGKCNMAYPFFHMRSEGFWHLIPGPGKENQFHEGIKSFITRLKTVVMGAEIDPELFQLISVHSSRDLLWSNGKVDYMFNSPLKG